ncbi:MAG: low affinity iron permease family protein [Pyrinomonadaceae bacterium]
MEDRSAESWFTSFAKFVSKFTGSPYAFGGAVLIVILWIITGPVFGFSDTWQLVINTGTTIVTFLMVFLIQNTQNRDSRAIQIKLDELIRSHQGAHNQLLDLEELDEKDLERIQKNYEKLARDARRRIDAGGSDTEADTEAQDDG